MEKQTPARRLRLLIYAHYYIPDAASTGQILSELAEDLAKRFDVTVICTVPSYLGKVAPEYREKKLYEETIGGVRVLRVRVPEFCKSDRRSRVKNLLSYFFGAMRATSAAGPTDCVLALSQPPILGGLLGVWGKWTRHAKLVYNIQDFNPEQIMAVGYAGNRLLLRVLMALDKFTCRRSNLIITVGRDLVETVHRRFHNRSVPYTIMVNNWIDERQIHPLSWKDSRMREFRRQWGLDGAFVVMYSGNIGLYYDLENLMKVIEKFPEGTCTSDGRRVKFAFVGEGALLETLRDYRYAHNMDNVVFIPYQDKEDLAISLGAADVHWCVNARGIKGVSCPSKFYGIAAAAKPALAVLEKGSEIRCIIEETRGGLCADPGDYAQIEANLREVIRIAPSDELFDMGDRNREYLERFLTRERSVKRYADEIAWLCREGKR